jgi:parvulin-like peptidyl-prolyl isomerase
MRWHGWLTAASATLAVIACGCLGKASTLADAPPPLASTGPPQSTELTRAQNPDPPNPPNTAVCRLINMPVDKPIEAKNASPAAAICAVVNGELILQEELLLGSMHQLIAARTPKERDEILQQALESLIDRDLLVQDAVAKLKRGGKQGEAFLQVIRKTTEEAFEKMWLKPKMQELHLSSRLELADRMRQSGQSFEVFCRWWERKYMAEQYLYSRLEQHINRIGHTEISEYYNIHRDEYTQPDSVDWQEIFLDAAKHPSRADARQFAESLIQRVRQGEDFAKLSFEFDNGESGRFRKGEGSGHKPGEIFPREAEPLLFKMHDGDMEILERPRGFEVIRLVKRQYAGPIPFDAKVQKEIRNKLKQLVFLREKDSIVKDLKRKAVIDRYLGPQSH